MTPLPCFSEYHRYLVEKKLSCNTRIAYEYQVAHFFCWLVESGKELPADPIAWDRALAEYKTFLQCQKGAKNASVNAASTAIKNFCGFIGMDEPELEPRFSKKWQTSSDVENSRPAVPRSAHSTG
jgi:site-specific recombinase XerC